MALTSTSSSTLGSMSQILLGLVSLPVLCGLFLMLKAVRHWFRQAHLHDIPGPPRTSFISGESFSGLQVQASYY